MCPYNYPCRIFQNRTKIYLRLNGAALRHSFRQLQFAPYFQFHFYRRFQDNSSNGCAHASLDSQEKDLHHWICSILDNLDLSYVRRRQNNSWNCLRLQYTYGWIPLFQNWNKFCSRHKFPKNGIRNFLRLNFAQRRIQNIVCPDRSRHMESLPSLAHYPEHNTNQVRSQKKATDSRQAKEKKRFSKSRRVFL